MIESMQFSVEELKQLRSLLIIAASGMGLIGIPMLINLLIRIQDVNAKILEKRSPKAIKEELVAFEELRLRETQELVAQADKRQAALTDMIASVELQNRSGLSVIDAELGRLTLYVGSMRGRKLLAAILADMDYGDAPPVSSGVPPGRVVATNLLAGYNESLQRQIDLVRPLSKDSNQDTERSPK